MITSFSCKIKKDKHADALARVYENYLYTDDVKGIVPKGLKPEDSIALVKKYINGWIAENLILHKAEQNLTEEQKNVDKQIKDYRNSLITFAYERELIKQKLDTVITSEEIETYYSQNKNNFELKDNIIKVLYVKVSKKSPKIQKIKTWYRSELPKDRELLESYCHQYAENFYLDDNSWLLFDDLLKEIPIQAAYNKELFLQNNRFIEVSDSSSLYFVNIKGFQIKNSISPLAFEKENIKNIILNKRKLELISSMKAEVLKEAGGNKNVEEFK
ncbi:MAG: hypothetical protein IT235_04490 [Bacteroidia bacterium]|nr:hypothetical protein [Bacteroidia bacterium]